MEWFFKATDRLITLFCVVLSPLVEASWEDVIFTAIDWFLTVALIVFAGLMVGHILAVCCGF